MRSSFVLSSWATVFFSMKKAHKKKAPEPRAVLIWCARSSPTRGRYHFSRIAPLRKAIGTKNTQVRMTRTSSDDFITTFLSHGRLSSVEGGRQQFTRPALDGIPVAPISLGHHLLGNDPVEPLQLAVIDLA